MPEIPGSVRIREIDPRDGFQNDPEVIATTDKVRLIGIAFQSGRLDLNQRPFGPQPNALPDCATPRDELECYGSAPGL
jgi:hydroxymethylglutaryl-CoA lyase